MSSAGRRALFAVAVPLVLLATAGSAFAISGDPGPGEDPPVSTTETYTLTVTPPPAGTITGTGISCPGDCAEDFQEQITCAGVLCEPDDGEWTTVTLTASRGTGWAPSWTGCGWQTGSSCNVEMADDRTVSVAWSDVGAPTVSLTSPQHGGVAGSSMLVSASTTDNAGVTRVDYYIDDVLGLTSLNPPFFSAWLSTTGYDHGDEIVVKARATDSSGNVSTLSAGRTVTVDRQVGLAVGTPPAFTNTQAVPVSILTDPDADVTCRIVGGPAPLACDDGEWSGVNATSPDGSYTYEVKATDAVDNTATVTRSFVLDRTVPVIGSFDGPTEGSVVGTDRVTFTFAASDANLQSVGCKVGSAAAGPCTSVTSHEITGLTDGTKTFSLIVTDKAGNQTTRTRTFQVQRPQEGTGSTGGATTQTQTQGTTGTVGSSSTPQAGPGGGPREELKANPAKLVFKKQRRAARTRLVGLRLTGVPQGATIAATCKGGAKKGCPRKAIKALRKGGTVKLAALAKLRLRKGAVLTITVTAPGFAPKTMTVKA